MRTSNKLLFSIMFFSAGHCFAVQSSPNFVENEYQKTFLVDNQKMPESVYPLTSITQIPAVTYQYLEGVFSSFYQKISFNTSITDTTFVNTLESELVAIPLIATNHKGFQFEIFGNFCDSSKQYLSNLSSDHALYDFIANSQQIDYIDGDLSLGAGVSFNTGQASKIRVLISNDDMPGYGSSRTLVGFETRF